MTARYTTVTGHAIYVPEIGESVTARTDWAYSYIKVPKEANLYADVCQWGTGTFPFHMITYFDGNDICVGFDAPVETLKKSTYNRFKLHFPKDAVYAMVTSANSVWEGKGNFPPKIYKLKFD